MQTPLDYAEQDGIVTLTMNMPEIRNAISSPEMIDALVEACERLNADMNARVAILTGAGTAYKLGIQRIPLAFDALEVPIIAAVNGPAIGAGCDLACMCDIRIAAESATFAESFVKLGIIPGDGGAWLLPRAVGFSKACEMAFTGDMVKSAEALACGLVSKVVPDGELMTAARALAERIAANPPHAVRMTKRLIRGGRDISLAALLELSAAMQSLAHATRDHKEAVTAFLDKRRPTFTGA
jgi:enoyl-CoA hydratase/carnithine racemase